MSYVFLSYNESSEPLALQVHRQLESLGIRTWVRDNALDWSQEENNAILVKAIQSASALLIIVPHDQSSVDQVSRDAHYGYQHDKPVLMLRRFEDLPAFLQRINPLIQQAGELSPLPQPYALDMPPPPSFLQQYGRWIVGVLLVSALVAGGLFALIVQTVPTTSDTLVTATSATSVAAIIEPTQTPSPAAVLPTQTITLAPTRLPATQTSTPTLLATASPTSTPTRTPSPSATATRIPSATPTTAPAITATLVPPATLTSSPTPLPIVTFTLAPSVTVSGCPPPEGWIAYSVIGGDTLFSIATRANSSVATLRTVNCLADADTIFVGQTLYIPPLTVATASATDIVLVVEGCDIPEAAITTPTAGESLNGAVEIRGSANIGDFRFYRLELRRFDQQTFSQIAQVSQPVSEDILWVLDTETFASGIYFLRLVVVNQRGTFPSPCTIPVLFE
jgi:LysM repeat protein